MTDLRTLTKLVLKLAGLYLLINALAALPSAIHLPEPYNRDGIIAAGAYAFVGFLLIWVPGGVINTVIRIPPGDLEGVITAQKLLRVGCVLLGVYFTVTGAYNFLFTYGHARLFYDVVKPFANSRGPELHPEQFARLVAHGFMFFAGLLLWIGSKYVTRAAGRFQ